MGETEISPVGNAVCSVSNDSVKAISSPEPETVKQDGSTASNMRHCTECGKSFSKPSKLRTHMFLHSGERPFVCNHPGCDKAYTSSSHLLRHKKSHQERDINIMLMCEVCKTLFKSPGGLRKHVKTVHESVVNNYACKQCGEGFRKKKLLAQHMQKHGGDPAFKCKICTLTFPLKHLFGRHMRGHKTHPCRVPGCTEVLANWSLYRKHTAEHNRAKGKACPVCNVIFPNRQILFDHVELHKESPFRCPYPPCPKVYQHKRNLNNHILVVHVGVRYMCYYAECDSKFISKQKLVSHVAKVHESEGGPAPRTRSYNLRATRKDRGALKRAMAPKLAGLLVPYSEEKRLLEEDRKKLQGVGESPESGFSSLTGTPSGSTAGGNEENATVDRETEVSTRGDDGTPTEPEDASDLQGPSETQRRNEDPHDTSSDESFMYSGGESSDEDSGSGHCEDDDDEEGDGDGDDGGEDDEEGDDDDFHDDDDDDEGEEDDDEGEEGNGLEDEEGEEQDDANHLAQGEGSNGKRAGSESLSRDEIHDGAGDLGVDRDGSVPAHDFNELGSPDSGENGYTSPLSEEEPDDPHVKRDESWERERNQKASKRKSSESDSDVAKKRRKEQNDDYAHNSDVHNGIPDDPLGDDTLVLGLGEPPVNIMHLDRNVDPKIFEVSLPKEKASKKLSTEVWVSTFQKSIDNCLPVKIEVDDDDVLRQDAHS